MVIDGAQRLPAGGTGHRAPSSGYWVPGTVRAGDIRRAGGGGGERPGSSVESVTDSKTNAAAPASKRAVMASTTREIIYRGDSIISVEELPEYPDPVVVKRPAGPDVSRSVVRSLGNEYEMVRCQQPMGGGFSMYHSPGRFAGGFRSRADTTRRRFHRGWLFSHHRLGTDDSRP
jgi:hypothetical protein